MEEQQVDRISELPCDIIVKNILCRLPIKEAGRTSVLSKKWRYKWSKMPVLRFDDPSISRGAINSDKLARMIDHVLLLRDGPIDEFSLYPSYADDNFDACIDRWILHLSRRSVKVLRLDGLNSSYKVTSHLFSCLDLVSMFLFGCSINVPPDFGGFKNLESLMLLEVTLISNISPDFEGFKNLKRLCLQSVTLTRDTLENLISSSPSLEELTLIRLNGVSSLRIDASNLKDLVVTDIFGLVRAISFGSTACSSSLKISLYFGDNCSINTLEFLRHTSLVQMLALSGYTLKLLTIDLVGKTLLDFDSFVNLKSLHVGINFSNTSEVRLVRYLLRSSPNLKEVRFQARDDAPNAVPTEGDFGDGEISPPSFKQLGFASFSWISGSKAEMEFIEGMLSYAIVLEKMKVTCAKYIGRDRSTAKDSNKILKELLGFRRASPLARIDYIDFD